MNQVIFNLAEGKRGGDNRPRTLKHKAYNYIKDKIIRCEYPPEAVISERDLIKELGISRTPIREAINLLQQENLVEIYPHRGVFVKNLSIKDIRDIFVVRRAIEPLVVELATPRLPMSVIEGFQEFYGNRQTPVSKEEHIERDRLFHTTIASYCDNQYLVQVLTNVYDQNSRARILSIRSDARQREAIQEHMAIIERMRERNAEAASEAMLQHILKAAEVAYHVVC